MNPWKPPNPPTRKPGGNTSRRGIDKISALPLGSTLLVTCGCTFTCTPSPSTFHSSIPLTLPLPIDLFFIFSLSLVFSSYILRLHSISSFASFLYISFFLFSSLPQFLLIFPINPAFPSFSFALTFILFFIPPEILLFSMLISFENYTATSQKSYIFTASSTL